MDRQLAERMVGAACLLAVLVLVVPAILDGDPDSDATITHPAVEEELDLRTHTIRLDGADREPPVPTPREAPAASAAPEVSGEPPPEPGAPALTSVVKQPDPGGSVPPRDPPPDPVPAAPASASPAPASPAPSRPAPEAVPAAAEPVARAAAGGDWIVQLGSFSSRANAARLAADVSKQGFNVSVEGGGGSSGTLFRVRAGPEADKAGAEALAGRLASAGFKGGRVGRK